MGISTGMVSQQVSGQLPRQLPAQVPRQVLGHGAGQATASSSHMMASGGPGLGPRSGLTPGHGVASLGNLLSPTHGFGNLFNEEASNAYAGFYGTSQRMHRFERFTIVHAEYQPAVMAGWRFCTQCAAVLRWTKAPNCLLPLPGLCKQICRPGLQNSFLTFPSRTAGSSHYSVLPTHSFISHCYLAQLRSLPHVQCSQHGFLPPCLNNVSSLHCKVWAPFLLRNIILSVHAGCGEWAQLQ